MDKIKLLATVLLSAGIAAAGQVFLKLGSVNFSLKSLFNKHLILGLAFYGISMLIYLVALSKTKMSLVYPLMSLAYIFGLVLAVFFLHEQVPLLRWIGTGVIVLGCWMVIQ